MSDSSKEGENEFFPIARVVFSRYNWPAGLADKQEEN